MTLHRPPSQTASQLLPHVVTHFIIGKLDVQITQCIFTFALTVTWCTLALKVKWPEQTLELRRVLHSYVEVKSRTKGFFTNFELQQSAVRIWHCSKNCSDKAVFLQVTCVLKIVFKWCLEDFTIFTIIVVFKAFVYIHVIGHIFYWE